MIVFQVAALMVWLQLVVVATADDITPECTLITDPGRTLVPPTANCAIYFNPTDLQIDLGSMGIPAHASVLEAVIPFFSKASPGTMESKIEELRAQHLHDRSVAALIRFAYTHKFKINDRNVLTLLAAAKFLQMPNAVDSCVDFLRHRINDQNVVATMNAAHSTQTAEIEALAVSYIASHFVQVAGTSEFLGMSSGALLKLMRSNETHATPEQDLFEAAHRWTRHNIGQPEAVKSEILESVRYSLMNSDSLAAARSQLSDTNCSNLMESIDDLLHVQKYTFLSVPWAGPTAPALSFQPLYNRSRSIAGAPQKLEFTVAVDNCSMYMIGGTVNSGKEYSVDVYSPLTEQWRSVVGMKYSRQEASATNVNGVIYITGGLSNKILVQNTAERFDIRTGKWETLASMIEYRYGHRLVALGGYLYAMGGYSGPTSVEKYDISTNTWTAVASMRTGRWLFGAAVLNGKIYVCGGETGSYMDFTNTAEVYDPVRDTWTQIQPMHREKHRFSLVVYMDQLWALAGNQPAEVYDPAKDTWTEVSDQWHSSHDAVETVVLDC